MSMTSSGGKGLTADINVTPLIDVLLVLLIIFMVIQPAVVHGLDAVIPKPPKLPVQEDQSPQAIVVQVLDDKEHGVTYQINETLLSKVDLEPRLAEIFSTRTEKAMFIKGDAALDFSSVAEVIDYGHQAGVENIGIVTPRSGGVQDSRD